jgi:serine/threonine protein kinase
MEVCPFCNHTTSSNTQTCPNCGAYIAPSGLPNKTALRSGQYVLEHILGQGGFGITYFGHDTVLQRAVAIKELFPDGSTRHGQQLVPTASLGAHGFHELKSRFLEEAQTLARFNHPGVVRVFDTFEEHGTAFLVMEALEGHTLGQAIERLGKLNADAVHKLGLQLGAALEVVHTAGLLHRDIKPDNVFLTHDHRTVLIDFGSARTYRSDRTVRHTQLVTPGYAAPEQYASSAKFAPYTDVYGLAATLYHALVGHAPPTATDRFVGTIPFDWPKNISQTLQTALEAGLALNVSHRPQSVNQFLGLLEGVGPAPKSSASLHDPMHEEVLFRSWDVVVTNKFVTHDGKTYPVPEIHDLRVQEKVERLTFDTPTDFPQAFVLVPAVVVFVTVGYLIVSVHSHLSLLPILPLFAIGLFLIRKVYRNSVTAEERIRKILFAAYRGQQHQIYASSEEGKTEKVLQAIRLAHR